MPVKKTNISATGKEQLYIKALEKLKPDEAYLTRELVDLIGVSNHALDVYGKKNNCRLMRFVEGENRKIAIHVNPKHADKWR